MLTQLCLLRRQSNYDDLNAVFNGPSRTDVNKGRIYLAPYEDSHYRARVDKCHQAERSVEVFFIDYGNTSVVHCDALIVIDDDMIKKVKSKLRSGPDLIKIFSA